MHSSNLFVGVICAVVWIPVPSNGFGLPTARSVASTHVFSRSRFLNDRFKKKDVSFRSSQMPWNLRCQDNNGQANSFNDDASMDAFRALLEEGWQTKQTAAEDRPFDGYQLRDLIVEKWTVPYDVQFKREVFMGKPMLFLNVMWKFEGQMSFPLTEQEYLEHLQAIAELLIRWDRVEHVRTLIKECKKFPNAYFGYAVPLPLDLPGELMREINIPEAR
mmetsp:Transcript_50841/g.106232  ORF Transcript_50841/g.106232 Transcript_50841/m.106232 type:complete len:218 (-) Transcript_50841:51-704(-)